jgi:hypothetical protein
VALTLRTTKPNAIDPAGRYRAWQSSAAAEDDVKLGEVRRGDDPVVANHPEMFVPDEMTLGEQPHEFDRVVREQNDQEAAMVADRRLRFEQAARSNATKLAPPLMFRSTRDLLTHRDGRPTLVPKGSVLLATDPLRGEHEDAFKPA